MNTLQILFALVAIYLLIGVLFATWFHGLKPDREEAPIGWSELVLVWPFFALITLLGIALVCGFGQTDVVEVRD